MASYLLYDENALESGWQIVEADSARHAVDTLDIHEGTVLVWTLRSGEPRTYRISTETVRRVERDVR